MSRTRSLAALGVAGVMTLTGCIFDDVKKLKQEVAELKQERDTLRKYLNPNLATDHSLTRWLHELGLIVCQLAQRPGAAGIEDPENMCPDPGEPHDVKSVPPYPPR